MRTQRKRLIKKEEIAQVATISAEDEEMGNLIAEVMEEAGEDGVVTVERVQDLWFRKRSC